MCVSLVTRRVAAKREPIAITSMTSITRSSRIGRPTTTGDGPNMVPVAPVASGSYPRMKSPHGSELLTAHPRKKNEDVRFGHTHTAKTYRGQNARKTAV